MLFSEIDKLITDQTGEMIGFLRKLVACRLPSTDESEGDNAQQIVESFLKDLGFSVTRDEPIEITENDGLNYGSRYSVVGLLKGKGDGKSIAINSHADVVGVGDIDRWKHDPRCCEIVDGKIYGRGVVDARGCLTAYLFALKALIDSGVSFKGDIIFQSVGDEEILGKGSEKLVKEGHTADAVLVGEPTSLDFCPATRGAGQFIIDVYGRTTHSGVAYEGENAILKAIPIIEALQSMQYRLDKEHMHVLWENYPIAHVANIALIEGGESPSKVPSRCRISGLAGCIAGETLEDVYRWVDETIKEASEKDNWLKENPPKLTWADIMQFEPSVSRLDHDFLGLGEKCQKEVLGHSTKPRAFTAVSDLRYFIEDGKGLGANFGPGSINQAHSFDEHLDIDELIAAVRIIARFVYRWTNTERSANNNIK